MLLGSESALSLFDASAHEAWSVPAPGAFRVAQSPDGRLVVAALRDGTVRWYRASDGVELLALFLQADGKRWVAFTPSGYYAAGPGGEDLVGWQVDNGPDRAADFFPASKFRNRFYRPDVVSLVLKTLDEAAAVQQAEAATAQPEAPKPEAAEQAAAAQPEAPKPVPGTAEQAAIPQQEAPRPVPDTAEQKRAAPTHQPPVAPIPSPRPRSFAGRNEGECQQRSWLVRVRCWLLHRRHTDMAAARGAGGCARCSGSGSSMTLAKELGKTRRRPMVGTVAAPYSFPLNLLSRRQ